MKKFIPLLGFLLMMGLGSWILYLPQESFWRESSKPAGPLPRVLLSLERNWYDLKMRSQIPESSEGVLVAKIDDASLKRFGRWPWSRRIYGDILESLYNAGASVVGFDAVFSEAEWSRDVIEKSFETPIESLKMSLSQALNLKDQDLDLIAKNLPEIGDRIFSAAIGRYPKTVLGYIWLFEEDGSCRIYDRNNPDHQKVHGNLDNLEARNQGFLPIQEHEDALGSLYSQSFSAPGFKPFDSKNKGNIPLGYCVVGNRSSISGLALHSGAFNALSDEDGILRRSQLLFAFNPNSILTIPEDHKDFIPGEWISEATFFPSLSLRVLMAHWGLSKAEVLVNQDKQGRRKMKEIILSPGKLPQKLRIPTLADGSMMLRFLGSQESLQPPIKTFSLADLDYLTDPKFQLEKFGKVLGKRPLENKIILIGPTALGVYDIRPTPIQKDSPGVFVHAATVSRILDFAKTGEPPGAKRVSWAWTLLIFVLAGVTILGFSLLRRFWLGLLSSVGLLLILPIADYFLFTYYFLLLPVPSMSVLLLVIFSAVTLYRYFTEEKQKAFVKSAFQKYVSPEVVQSILAHPENLNLGGKKQELSLLFADIRGFTTFAEKMEASDLSLFLNEYLSEMTDVILDNGGTIDKYIGDAVVAIFGAPIPFADHPARAARAALQMSAKLDELNLRWAEEKKPVIEIGIGINSGEASVGNMGSRQIFSYTAVGDTVNLAARLESLNKQLGTRILISAETYRKLPESLGFKFFDKVRVVGKQAAVDIYTLPLPSWKNFYRDFEVAHQLYSRQKFAESVQMLLAWQDFLPAFSLSRRCELFIKQPPGPEWDGAWTIQEK